MQLVPRYLVKNRINIISDTAGLFTEYRPVYQRTIKISRGIDNVIQFKLLNSDQKPVTVTQTPVFVAFDDDRRQIFEKECTVLDDGSTRNTLGMFIVTITDIDLLNVPQQYLKYNVYLTDNNGNKSITYANTDFTSAGVIYVDGSSYPGPVQNQIIDKFFHVETSWVAGSDGNRTINANTETANDNLTHSMVIYPRGYAGTLTVQGTLDGSMGSNWFDIVTTDISGTDLIPLTFTGSYTFLRFKLDNDPSTNTPRIVLRN